jgi:hypothetical protein
MHGLTLYVRGWGEGGGESGLVMIINVYFMGHVGVWRTCKRSCSSWPRCGGESDMVVGNTKGMRHFTTRHRKQSSRDQFLLSLFDRTGRTHTQTLRTSCNFIKLSLSDLRSQLS